jgi:sugar lactone lactonase YvrE
VTTAVDVLCPATANLGEGPCWDADREALIWVDILAGTVHVDRDGASRAIEVGGHVGAAVPCAGGGLALVRGLGFGVLDLDAEELQTVALVPGDDTLTRFNDGKADPAGRFWAGTMRYDEASGGGALYRLDEDGPRAVLEGVTVCNGIAWTPAGDRMYHIDSPTRRVAAYDVDPATGDLVGRSIAVVTGAFAGVPDGMTLDDDGNLWIAFFGGAAVRCFSPAGELLEVLELPVTNPTSCCFAGPERDRLCITTARYGLSPHALRDEPAAGSVLMAEPGVRGPAAVPARMPRADTVRPDR